MVWLDALARRKKNKIERDEDDLMSKVRAYVDDMPDMTDVSEFRAATAKAIAAHNEMKLDARTNCDQELFDLLLPFSEYFLKSITASAFRAAENKATEVELTIRCGELKKYSVSNFHYSDDRQVLSVAVLPYLVVNDVKYEFQEEKKQWQYFYQLARWLEHELEGKGFSLSPIALFGHADGWSSAKDSVMFRLRWGDDVFVDAVKKFDDVSQVEAYLAGVPIEDIVI